MKLGEIKHSDEILSIIRGKKLVVFAGAGVSMRPGMKLPNYGDLTRSIASTAGQEYPGERVVPCDRYLGQLHDAKVAVHSLAQQIIDRSSGQSNDIHADLIALFGGVDDVRIVTTNYDYGFEQAAQNRAYLLRSYSSPALPLGNDFKGIVHVHGAARDLKGMVLTDKDFGRAYLTEGWARRFLVSLFEEYNVLFVGYSCRDHDINYLVRAIVDSEKVVGRFVMLTDRELEARDGEDDPEQWWAARGIKPIVLKTYEEQDEAIRTLVRYAERSPDAICAQLARVLSQPPPLLDEEVPAEIKHAMQGEDTVRYLTRSANDVKWVRYLYKKGYLAKLFSGEEADAVTRELAAWLAKNFINDHDSVLVEILSTEGFRINPYFRSTILRYMRPSSPDLPLIDELLVGRWVVALMRTYEVTPGCRSEIVYLAERCSAQGLFLHLPSLFLSMAKEKLLVRWRPNELGGASLEHQVQADRYHFNQMWEDHLKPRIAGFEGAIIRGVSELLEQMYAEHLAWSGRAGRVFMFGRSAIEEHEQDHYRDDAMGVVIDAMRDSVESLIATPGNCVSMVAEQLLTSSVPLIRRVGVHCLRLRPDMTSAEKVNLLFEHVQLSDHEEYHEVYRLIAQCYKDIGDVDKAKVRIKVSECAKDLQQRHDENLADRFAYEWLSCLVLSAPACVEARASLDALQSKHPKWVISEHPDFRSWIGKGEWLEPSPALYAAQLVAMSPSEVIELYPDAGSRREIYALNAQLRQACVKNPELGKGIMRQLAEAGRWQSLAWAPIIESLEDETIPLSYLRDALVGLNNDNVCASLTEEISRLLDAVFIKRRQDLAACDFRQLDEIADKIWVACEAVVKSRPRNESWLQGAYNCPAGRVAVYWIDSLAFSMAGKKGDDLVLPSAFESLFTKVIQDSAQRGGYARSILAGHFAYLHRLNPSWANKLIAPLFSSETDDIFLQAWDGFLKNGRMTHSVESELRPALISAIGRFLSLPDSDSNKERLDLFIRIYAMVVVFSKDGPSDALLRKFLVKAHSLNKHKSIADLASNVGFYLRQLSIEAQSDLSRRWGLGYLSERIRSMPVPIAESEFSKMLKWVLYFGDGYADAVGIIAGFSTATVTLSPTVLHTLEDTNLPESYPTATAEFLICLSRCKGASDYRDYFSKIAIRLNGVATGLKGRLRDSLMSIGANL